MFTWPIFIPLSTDNSYCAPHFQIYISVVLLSVNTVHASFNTTFLFRSSMNFATIWTWVLILTILFEIVILTTFIVYYSSKIKINVFVKVFTSKDHINLGLLRIHFGLVNNIFYQIIIHIHLFRKSWSDFYPAVFLLLSRLLQNPAALL